ncbi:acyltransferase family protein [Sphingobium sp. CAP-1]|uniref:acyltransferase family protein n=1 Tax=Sphingobium sp. CAP-1 TaxID=2676077 RepID=UPI0018AD28C8|nr:acyltransferase [Sphingobium sp. CAP-1]
MSATARPSSTIRTVELARGIAAMLVVIFHANASADEFGGPQWSWLSFGEHGVDFFFVLSGFIIMTAHGGDIGTPGTARPYLLKRAIRLLPPLWIIVLGWAALRTLLHSPVDPMMVARSALLWPSMEPTLPAVVWTLRHEMLFYAMFLLLLVHRPIGYAAFLLWGAAAIGQLLLAAIGSPFTGLPSFFLSTFTLDFMLGMGLALMHRHRLFTPTFAPLLAAVAFVIALLMIDARFVIHRTGLNDYVSFAATWWTLLLGLGFAGVLHGLMRIELRVRIPQAGVFLGAASYTIYLLHTIANSFTQRIAIHLPAAWKAVGMGHLLLILAGTVAAMLFYVTIEKPLTRTLRRRLVTPPHAAASNASSALPLSSS